MYGKKLTDQEIQVRLTEGHNYKRLYTELKLKLDELKTENKELRQLLQQALAQSQTQAIQIAELQTMVFGKKKKPPMGGTPIASDFLSSPKQPRSKASYRRPIPPATAITAEVVVPLPEACVCGGGFEMDSVMTHEQFVEDIPLPELTPGYQAKLVTKYRVERGICLKCGQDLGGAQVALGPNVRLLVTHLIAGVSMSYSQVVNLILSLYGLTVSDGEIASLLQKQHQAWLPAYNQLATDRSTLWRWYQRWLEVNQYVQRPTTVSCQHAQLVVLTSARHNSQPLGCQQQRLRQESVVALCL